MKFRQQLWLLFIVILMGWGCHKASANTWYASGEKGADSNPGTLDHPVATVAKAISLAKPGDTVLFAPGKYPCSAVTVPDGTEGLPIVLRSTGKGKVVFTNDGHKDQLIPGSFNVIDGIEFHMISDGPDGNGIRITRKEQTSVRNCRFFACRIGVRVENSENVTITNCEMAYSGADGIATRGSGSDEGGHWNPADECKFIEIRNCYLHDAGWNVKGTEGYGISAGGAVENLVIENCQIDNNSGDGILYEDWCMQSTARHNVIRGTGIAAIWIDNASMAVFDGNYLEGNNVSVWLSGEVSSNRYRSDFISIRNNIIVHNDWTALAAFDPTVYGKNVFYFTSNTRDVYIDNNTVAFNNSARLVSVDNRPPQNEFGNIHFRNNIFWKNTGDIGADAGVDFSGFHFDNNLWEKSYKDDAHAKTGDPMFMDPAAHTPDGYKLQRGSAAIDVGLRLYENPLDFWNAPRPHLSKTEKYDVGAHQFGVTGSAHVGLDLKTFPFDVPTYKLRFKAKPRPEDE